MPTTLTISWSDPEIQFVIVRNGQVLAAANAGVSAEQDATTIGLRLAEALAPHSLGKAKTIVAIGRKALEWQLLSLPPCPADELPGLVRLQADHEISEAEEDVGFDFLPLVGDEQTPYQVLTVAMAAGEITKIQQVCRAAGLAIEHVVPLALGWPAIVTQHATTNSTETKIFVTPFAHEATLWAFCEGRIVLLRQLQLVDTDNIEALAASMNNELRRTLLALSQLKNNTIPTVTLVGGSKEELLALSTTLESQHGMSSNAVELESNKKLPLPAGSGTLSYVHPLGGLGLEKSNGKRPVVDLLHPRKCATTNTNTRTYVLAGIAAALAALMLGWQGYTNLQAPLEQASRDQAELTLLEDPLDDLGKYEQKAGAIRDWESEAANVLVHLRKVSESIRPQTLESEDFPLDKDVVLDKFLLERRILTIDAMARNNQAMQPLEVRLRTSGYRPQRGKSEPSKELEGYPWHFRSTIEIPTESDSASAPPNEEPQA